MCIRWRIPQPSAEILAKLRAEWPSLPTFFRIIRSGFGRIINNVRLLMWIVILTVPLLALVLNTRGQLQWDPRDFTSDRI